MARRRYRKRSGWEPDDPEDPEDSEAEESTIDLHGCTVEEALQRLRHGLHAVRVRRGRQAIVITGRGLKSPDGRPILRPRVVDWLKTAQARTLGVTGFKLVNKGGAIQVSLKA